LLIYSSASFLKLLVLSFGRFCIYLENRPHQAHIIHHRAISQTVGASQVAQYLVIAASNHHSKAHNVAAPHNVELAYIGAVAAAMGEVTAIHVAISHTTSQALVHQFSALVSHKMGLVISV
jgi:hypothetical protein